MKTNFLDRHKKKVLKLTSHLESSVRNFENKYQFSTRKFAKVLSAVTFIYFTDIYFVKGVDKFIISPLAFSDIKQSFKLDTLSIVITLFGLVYITYLLLKNLIPSLNSLLNIFLLTTCYILVIRNSNTFTLVPVNCSFKYLDVIFFIFLIFITQFRYSKSESKFVSSNGFIEDDFNPKTGIDLLNRERYASQIAIKILDTPSTKRAFVIAINSPWGYGKSAFLTMMENFFLINPISIENSIKSTQLYNEIKIESLVNNHGKTIIIKYNPWKNFNDRKTLQDFFEEFSNSIKKYDLQLSKDIKSYGTILYKLDDSTFKKIIDATVEVFNNSQSQTKLFKEINKAIRRIQKKIIVFIDDLDRLTGDELFDILKLIRNTADFENTFFITAYDHNYVLNTIDKKGLISNKEEYLHKIVQLEITLPIFNRNILIQFLKDEFQKHEIFSQNFEPVDSALNEIFSIDVANPGNSNQNEFDFNTSVDISSFLSKKRNDNSLIFEVLRNIRDVVRFINSFKLTYD